MNKTQKKMKKTVFLLLVLLVSCSKNEELVSTNEEKNYYVSKVTNITAQGTTDLVFSYDSNNNVIKNETDTYYRTFSYSNNSITQIKSITKPSTPYYTINFVYNSDGKLIEVKRDNHYNNSVFYLKYEYYATGEVDTVYIFDSLESYTTNSHDRYYDVSGYIPQTTDFTGLDLFVYSSNLGFHDISYSDIWTYDSYKRPYFGDAVKQISIPFSTNGTGMDWDILYSEYNPTNITTFDFRLGIEFTRKVYNYEYNEALFPTRMTKKTYAPNGNLVSTFSQEFTYTLR